MPTWLPKQDISCYFFHTIKLVVLHFFSLVKNGDTDFESLSLYLKGFHETKKIRMTNINVTDLPIRQKQAG